MKVANTDHGSVRNDTAAAPLGRHQQTTLKFCFELAQRLSGIDQTLLRGAANRRTTIFLAISSHERLLLGRLQRLQQTR